MSTRAKWTFISTCIASAAIIGYVHFSQDEQRRLMRRGIEREENIEKMALLQHAGSNDISRSSSSSSTATSDIQSIARDTNDESSLPAEKNI